MPDDETKAQLDEMMKRQLARERASIRFGFPVGIGMIVVLVICFIVWRVTAGPLDQALVEIMSRRIELPASRFTYPLDGGPLLEEQWGIGTIPPSPFADVAALDFLIVDHASRPIFIEATSASHEHLIVAADSQMPFPAIARCIDDRLAKRSYRTLWFAARTAAVLGKPHEEIQLKPQEVSNLGVVLMPVVWPSMDMPPDVDATAAIDMASSDTCAGVIKALEAAYTKSRTQPVLLRMKQEPPRSSSSDGSKKCDP